MTWTPSRTLRTPFLLALLACVALVLAACGGDDEGDATTSTAAGGATSTAAEAPQGQAIQRNADNAKVTLTIGSKNFTEQKVLGEVYAQALEAAGYTVKKELNLGDEQTALKAVKGGQVDA